MIALEQVRCWGEALLLQVTNTLRLQDEFEVVTFGESRELRRVVLADVHHAVYLRLAQQRHELAQRLLREADGRDGSRLRTAIRYHKVACASCWMVPSVRMWRTCQPCARSERATSRSRWHCAG